MKKALFSLAICALVTANSYAYKIRVHNDTKHNLQSWIYYGGAGVCSPGGFLIEAKKNRSYDGPGGCCFAEIKFQKTSGGGWYTFDIPGKFLGMRCKSTKVRVKENKDGSLTLEQG